MSSLRVFCASSFRFAVLPRTPSAAAARSLQPARAQNWPTEEPASCTQLSSFTGVSISRRCRVTRRRVSLTASRFIHLRAATPRQHVWTRAYVRRGRARARLAQRQRESAALRAARDAALRAHRMKRKPSRAMPYINAMSAVVMPSARPRERERGATRKSGLHSRCEAAPARCANARPGGGAARCARATRAARGAARGARRARVRGRARREGGSPGAAPCAAGAGRCARTGAPAGGAVAYALLVQLMQVHLLRRHGCARRDAAALAACAAPPSAAPARPPAACAARALKRSRTRAWHTGG